MPRRHHGNTPVKAPVLHRRQVVSALLADRGDLLVVAGLGSSAWDCTAAGDHPLTFPLWGAMGQAAMTGLGLALARPQRRVLVVTGDGEALMGLGALATIGVQSPGNLTVVVLDNERYGETGMQPTHTHHGVDLAAVALACRFAWAATLTQPEEVRELARAVRTRPGPGLAAVKVLPEKLPLFFPPKEGAVLKDRFRRALFGQGGRDALTLP